MPRIKTSTNSLLDLVSACTNAHYQWPVYSSTKAVTKTFKIGWRIVKHRFIRLPKRFYQFLASIGKHTLQEKASFSLAKIVLPDLLAEPVYI